MGPRWLLIAIAGVPGAAKNSTGSPKCPCANVANITNNVTGIPVVVNEEVFTYPYDYGSTYCSAHDAGLEPFCADDDDNANFCGESWFVTEGGCSPPSLRVGRHP